MITRSFMRLVLAGVIAAGFITHSSYAGSATWNLDPTSSDWNKAANWTPATIPNSSSDTATFAVSNTTNVTLSDFKIDFVNAVVFNPGASAFTITLTTGAGLEFDGTGITNDSGVTQNFVVGPGNGLSLLTFVAGTTAGTGTVLTAYGSTDPSDGNFIDFFGGDAGTATLHATGGVSGGKGATIEFNVGGTADGATVILDGAEGNNLQTGALAVFDSTSDSITTAGNATFTINGAPTAGGSGGTVQFGTFRNSNPTAGNATLIANEGTDGGPGGTIVFGPSSTGGTARVELFGNGLLTLTHHVPPGVTLGSIEGDGLVTLGTNNLTVGNNRLSTEFSGVISGPGSLTKIGPGTLTLKGPNTYTGLTQVKQGKLLIKDRTGGLTIIKGSVAVNGGTFGGSGLVGGKVTVANNMGGGGVLEANQLQGGNFIIQKSLTFNSGATYQVDLNSNAGRYSNVWGNGVTIEEGAFFTMKDFGNSSFGPVNLGIINNTGSGPIVGEFANLPEGGSITVGQNTFYATYHGGDGNDFELTNVP